MHVLYLLFLSFVFNSHSSTNYVSGFVSGFVSHLPHTHTQIRSQTQHRSKTCFADEDDHTKHNQNIIPNILKQDGRVGMRNIVKSPLYIVIWKDCEDCKELLRNMELLDVKYFYFNMDNIIPDVLETVDFEGEDAEDQRRIVERRNSEKRVWNNLKEVQTKIEIPIFYKDDIYLGNKLMDIYCELYPM